MSRLVVRICLLLCGSVVTLSAQNTTKETPTIAPKSVAAAETPLDRRVTLNLRGVQLLTAVREIDRQAGLHLNYSERVLPAEARVTIVVDSVSARAALTQVLKGTGVVLRESAAGDLMLVRGTREGDRKAEGMRDTTGHAAVVVRVVDTVTSKPIDGAVVGVKGTQLTATTNDHGYVFLRAVPSGLREVTVRFLGYASAEQQIVIPDTGSVRVNFALHMGMTRLQEVVTTATGDRRRYELGNDITVINADSIVATEPVKSVTELLEGRVPGLVMQRTSGAPGDPTRLRLRGASSVYRSNDPIVVVDGIRVYSKQSDERGANLATRRTITAGNTGAYAAPSPLDYLDPASIETIEVVKGPSAATLYGPDAANGVIVITTKKGRAGPPRWTVSADHGRSAMAADFPDRLLRWGHVVGTNQAVVCPITNTSPPFGQVCQADSLVHFQMLSDPELSVLDRGQRSALSLGVTGGSQSLQYSFTGSHADEEGLLRLPAFEAARYREQHNEEPPDWMQRPQQLTQWGGTGRLSAQLGSRADVSVTSSYSRTAQQRSSLEGQLASLMNTYLDRSTGVYYRAEGFNEVTPVADLLSYYGERVSAASTQFTNAVNVTWRPLGWLTTTMDAGLNTIQRADEIYLPRGQLPYLGSPDTSGYVSLGTGTSVVSTVNLRTSATAPLPRDWRFQFAAGVNYSGNSIADLMVRTSNLAPGTSSPNQAGTIEAVSERREESATFGMYVEPSLSHKRLWLSTGIRMDGGSTYGSNVSLPRFPKVSLSYLVSDEPFFPFKNVFNVLRLRLGYGQAALHPGPTDRLRLYKQEFTWLDGGVIDAGTLSSVGNTRLRPERSTELEGGFDAELLDQRLSLSMTGYHTTKDDALMQVPLPPSVYGDGVNMLRNVGAIRNTGVDLSVGADLLRTQQVSFNVQLSLSRQRSQVVRLGAGVEPFYSSPSIRVAAGYPLYGRWAKPILGYSDVNEDGVIEAAEVVLGDTAVYVGSTLPNYTAALHTTATFFRGTLSVTAGLTYDDGLNQRNGAGSDAAFSPGWNDPSSPLGQQAAMAVLGSGPAQTEYGLLQTVSTLRFNSLSVAYHLPRSMAARLRAGSATVALQGTNLGIRTNYRGLDPNVNAFATGNNVTDTGVLPQPRSWQLRVRLTY